MRITSLLSGTVLRPKKGVKVVNDPSDIICTDKIEHCTCRKLIEKKLL